MTEIYIYKKSKIQCVSVCSVSSKDMYISLIQTFLSYPSVNEHRLEDGEGGKSVEKDGGQRLDGIPWPLLPIQHRTRHESCKLPFLPFCTFSLFSNEIIHYVESIQFLIRLFFEKSCSTRQEYNLVQSIRIGRFLKVAKRVIHIHTDWN